jgi:hypothetical protein
MLLNALHLNFNGKTCIDVALSGKLLFERFKGAEIRGENWCLCAA